VTLTVVAYNVLFGDAILVRVPEREGVRHILIDVGNVLAESVHAGVFTTVIADIERRLDGRPIDLYVMTHEHMDHVHGLLRAERDGCRLPPIDHAWLTASAASDYHERHPQAERQRSLHLAAYERVRRVALQRGLLSLAPVRAFLDNNNPQRTADCVAFLRGVARKQTSYVHRGGQASHPFEEAQLSIWAPEQDTSSYYGRIRPVAPRPGRKKLEPPPGVEPNAFEALVEFSQSGLGDEMLAIDRAANNTSVVFSIEWRGWRLLFCGDAELRSWKTMAQHKQLRPVHFLKVGHHASHNGTPDERILGRILPVRRPDKRPRTALVSTCPGAYNGVPDHDTLLRLERRVDRVVRTDDVPVGEAVEITFEESVIGVYDGSRDGIRTRVGTGPSAARGRGRSHRAGRTDP
jgi:beta-lactamase superfamily II metal-dependent hydrolase